MITLLLCSFTTCLRYFSDGRDKCSTEMANRIQPSSKSSLVFLTSGIVLDTAAGIHVKILATNAENDSVSMLVRLGPGTDYPGHSHAGIEELHLLHGILKVDDRTLYPGDFIHSEVGSIDHRVWSETGCTCFLFTSTQGAIF